jgi:hypothetical protein
MTVSHAPRPLDVQYAINITVPPNGAQVPGAGFPVQGNYAGTNDPTVLIQVCLVYSPVGPSFTTPKSPPEDPPNHAYDRSFNNVPPTGAGQVGLLTAYLFDPTGQQLWAQSATIQVTIV